jgi:hypothetical protein
MSCVLERGKTKRNIKKKRKKKEERERNRRRSTMSTRVILVRTNTFSSFFHFHEFKLLKTVKDKLALNKQSVTTWYELFDR